MKEILDFRIHQKQTLSPDFFTLELQHPRTLQPISPGQFVEVQVKGVDGLLLRRPISIHDVNSEKQTITLLIQKVGKGTEALAEKNEGEEVNIIYPLGKGFPTEGRSPLLVGGGCGIAPLLYLARTFNDSGVRPTLLLGCKTTVILQSAFENVGELFITTEDGSCGERGFVTQHSLWNSRTFDRIYTCGPEPMMKAVAQKAKTCDIKCYVSLENKMACGIGACLCCVTETTKGNQCTCSEGPVFSTDDLPTYKQ